MQVTEVNKPSIIDNFNDDVRLFDGSYLEKESQRNEGLSKLLQALKSEKTVNKGILEEPSTDGENFPSEVTEFLTFIVLNNKLKKIREQNLFLKSKLKYRNMNNNNTFIHSFHSNQRTRKRKSEVIRNFPCLYPNCDKAYGSKNSLR